MKEENGAQDVGATAFDYPNSQHPYPTAPMKYGTTPLPHPTNQDKKAPR